MSQQINVKGHPFVLVPQIINCRSELAQYKLLTVFNQFFLKPVVTTIIGTCWAA